MNESPRPLNLVAELSYRCPLRCPYCSNPLKPGDFPDALNAEDWARVFRQAAALGVVHVGLSGGEPSTRRDLPEITRAASDAGLYTHLVTAGLPLGEAGLEDLAACGLDSVQISLQDADPEASDRLAGTKSFAQKLAMCRKARALGLPLTLNVVLHRGNLSRVKRVIELARELDADRLELANAQYQGWALENRDFLLPESEQVEAAARIVAAERKQGARPELLFVLPDYFRERPKPCMGGWGRLHIIITPDGRVLPCHGAAELPGLEFWKVGERTLSECWEDAPGMNAFRGFDWMQEPCRSCPERRRDFGGCRCQAFALTGDAAATDPACALSAQHGRIMEARRRAQRDTFRYRENG